MRKQLFYQVRYALPLSFISLLTCWLPDNRFSIKIRGKLYSLILPGKPNRLEIGRDVTLLGIDKIVIGSDVYFAKGVWINGLGGIEIGAEVLLGPYVVLASTQHQRKKGSYRFAKSKFDKIVVGSGTWIGAHATIQSGAVIGGGSVVASNSVVNKKFPSNVLLAGVPAVIKKELDND